MKYPDKCKGCNQPLYGPVKFCPFCGKGFTSGTAISEKQKIDTPITEEANVSLLKEHGVSPVEEGADDLLSVNEPPAEKTVLKEETPQQPEPTISEEKSLEEETPETEVLEDTPPIARRETPASKPIFWKVVLVLGIIVVLVGYFYVRERKLIEEKEKIMIEAEKEAIRIEAEKKALAKADADRIRQEELTRQKEIERQRQEQEVRQREIDDYLSEGKMFFQKGEFKMCIEKMKEVTKRDRNNYEAERYIEMAQDELEKITNIFQNPNVGRAR